MRRPHGGIPAGLLAASLLATPLSGQIEPTLQGGDRLVVGGRLFTALDDRAVPNPGLLLRNGSILRIGFAEPSVVPEGVDVVRLPEDRTVLPGFFDLHAHYAVDLFGYGRVDEYEVNPVIFLANGVTSTFPAGEVDPEGMRGARERIQAGLQVGPRLYNSGPYYGSARPGWNHSLMTADSIRAEVDLWASRGARGFKAKGIRPEQLSALIEAAHRHGLTVTGHLDSGFRNTVNPREAILMGIDRIEHFMGGDAIAGDRSAYSSLESLDVRDPGTAQRILDAVELFKRHGVFFDATLTAYGYFGLKEPAVYTTWEDERSFLTPFAREAVEIRLGLRQPNEQFERIYHVKHQTLKAFYDAGGEANITVGTDHPSWGEFLSGFGTHREMQAMSRAGIPNAAVLRIATLNGARAMGVDARLGSIEEGKYADLVIVRGDPTRDILATRQIEIVIKAGERYDPRELLDSVKGKMGPEDESTADWWRGSVRFSNGGN